MRVLFETGSNQGYQFKTHPNIDKQLYASNVLGLKDSERPFPTGSALPILKWRMQVCNAAAFRRILPAGNLHALICAPPCTRASPVLSPLGCGDRLIQRL